MQENTPPLGKILIVSEDELFRDLISICLTGLKKPVVETPDAQKAFDLITQYPRVFEILITDNQMTVLTGIELITLLKEIDHTFKKIILTSADIEGNQEVATLIKIEPKVKLLKKPFTAREILETVLFD